MSFGIKQSRKNKTWTSLLVEESEYSHRAKKTRRNRTFRRMYMSVFVLFGSAFLVISSMFYVGAFFDVGKIVGVSQAQRAENAKAKASTSASKERNFFTPFIDLVQMDRVYLRSGQTILATYDLPKNAQMTLVIKQCKSKPILEVFDCELVGEQKKTITRKSNGFTRFTVANPGFYHFSDTVKIGGKSVDSTEADYRVIWQRG